MKTIIYTFYIQYKLSHSPFVEVNEVLDILENLFDQLSCRGGAQVMTQLGNLVDAVLALLIRADELLLIGRLCLPFQGLKRS